MRIAILTQPICNNYGGILQNYALQTVLERDGHSVTTLNYPVVPVYSGSPVRHVLSTAKRLLQKIGGDPKIIWVDIAKEARKQVELAHLQKLFIDERLHLKTINPPLTFDQVKDFGFDAYVVGSDQVWRPRYNHYIENMFLDFTEGSNVKRVAYAASLGTDKWEYSVEETERCARWASNFNAISVREHSGVGLLKEYLNVDASHVLDPTLLLSKEDYLSICSGGKYLGEEYIAVYVLDYSKEKISLLNEISRELHCPLRFIGRFTKSGYPSVESWLEGIARAKYVVTDSYHGTVFSAIFEKQFVTLGNLARGNSRFESLFESLGIPSNRLTIEPSKIESLLKTPLEYDSILARKNEMQNKSHFFLHNSL